MYQILRILTQYRFDNKDHRSSVSDNGVICLLLFVQYSLIGLGLRSVLTSAFLLSISDLKSHNQFWILHQKLHVSFSHFFVKPQNGLVWLVFVSWCFLGELVPNLPLLSSIWYFTETETNGCMCITCIKIVCTYGFKEGFKKLLSCARFCLYLVVRSISINTGIEHIHTCLTSNTTFICQ